MSKSFAPCEINLEFGSESYRFKLPLKQIAELQVSRSAGIGAIYARVLMHQEFLEDCLEIIRLGLIGGGLDGIKARELMKIHEDMPHDHRWAIAAAILGATMHGYEGAKLKKKARSETRKDGSTSPPPMEIAPSREDSLQSSSTP